MKRDLVDRQFPYVLQPRASWAFAAVLGAAAIAYVALLRPGAVLDRPPRPPAVTASTRAAATA